MKNQKIVVSIFFLSFFLLTGCNKVQGEKPVVLSAEDKSILYVTINPAYEDLILEESIDCKYSQTKMYDLSFGLTGIPIELIDVKLGEQVKKGQFLASLELGNAREELAELEHNLELAQLKLQQIKELRDKDLSIAKYVYQRTSNIYKYEDTQEEIEREYEKEIEQLEHEVILCSEKVNAASEQVNKGTIYAPVAGEITYAQSIEDEKYSKKDSTMITVSDLSECYFRSYSTDYKEYFGQAFQEGEIYQMRCLENGQYCYYNVTPVIKETWEDKKIISFVLTNKEDLVALGTIGNIIVNREEKNNVLCLPQSAIHETETKKFVYVLKDGIRKMQYIEVGLSSNGKTEIKSGLTEQDDIIMEQSMEEETSSTEQGEGAGNEE